MAALKKLKTFTKNKKKVRTLGVFSFNGRVYLYFQNSSDLSTQFSVATSTDGFSFELEKRKLYIKKGVITNEDITLCQNFSISEYAGYFLMIYVRTENKKTFLEKAWSKDLISWAHEGNMIPLSKSGMIVPNYTYKGKSILYSSQESIFVYSSTDLIHWKKEGKELLTPRKDSFDCGKITIESITNSEKGILLLYHSEVKGVNSVGIALFDRDNPTNLLWRNTEPLWIAPKEWDKKKVQLIGTVLNKGNILAYWQVDQKEIYVAVYGLYKISNGHTSKDVSLKLKRPSHNPLISPKSKNAWEAFNTFNPAAIYDNGKVHILYRAQGHDYVSTLGYAATSDGIHIDERLDYPVYTPSRSFEQISDKKQSQISTQYISGGGYGGCEDPRISRIDDRYYLTYVAFDGMNPPRVALTSISVENFLNKRWLWERPVLISPPGVVDKSAIIFPQKINGKYVIMHRIYPNILVDFVDSLNFDGSTWLKGEYKISPRARKWDSRKIGAGAPPLKTKYGWLLIYQSVGEQDPGRYKIGAMLLDLKDPTKVLHRSQSPILEPDAIYENEGFKAGVIYPCGAVIIGDTLYVYYGAADSYVCVATANLEEFLSELRHSEIARLTTPIMERIF
jgi:beta-1,2-mannobiose phosphorylase / 1,2-beta-oligomannan phosphorylase